MKTEINIYIVLVILFIHWIADFVFQTDYQAKNKSKSISALIDHTLTYTACWIIPIGIVGAATHHPPILFFLLITFICHTITDFYTSKLNASLWEEGKVHWFFVSVGFDQFLHFVQLLITYQLLS